MPATLSSDQFAQQIKAKYPQYAGVDNTTLTQKIIAKYPQYSSRVNAATPSPIISGLKAVGNFLTTNEQAAGQDIAAAIGAGGEIRAAAKTQSLADQGDINFIKAMKARQAQGVPLTPMQQQIYSDILNHHGSASSDVLNAPGQNFPALNKTNEQVIGDFAGLTADLALTGGGISTAAATAAPARGVLAGVGRGAIEGAKQGAMSGGLYGAASGMQQNQSAGGVALSTGVGAAIGAAGGAVVGGAVGGVRGAIAAKTPEQINTELSSALQPKLTPTKVGKVGAAGNLESPTMFGKAGVSSEAPQVQRAVDGVTAAADALGKKPTDIIQIGPLSSATKNVNNVSGAIGDYSKKIVQPFLQENAVPTHFEDFINYLHQVNPPAPIKASPEASQAFSRIRERVISEVYKSLKSQSAKSGDFGSLTDPNIYWNARQRIDDIITEELGATTLGDKARTGIQAAAQALRGGVADFISDMLRYPGQTEQLARYREAINALNRRGFDMSATQYHALADQMGLKSTGAAIASKWDTHMQTLSGLFQAKNNLLTRTPIEQGKTLLQIAAKKKPMTMKLIKAAAIGAAGAVGAGGVFEAGRTILGE